MCKVEFANLTENTHSWGKICGIAIIFVLLSNYLFNRIFF